MSSAGQPAAVACGSLGCRNTTGLQQVIIADKGRRVLCASCRDDLLGGSE